MSRITESRENRDANGLRAAAGRDVPRSTPLCACLRLASRHQLYRLKVMKKVALLLGLLAAVVLPGAAQVSVEVTLDQEQFLPGEPLIAAVRISNRSGQTLHLGEDDKWLAISIEQKNGPVVQKLADIPIRGPFTVESSKRATKRVDLAPCFALTEPGRYEITATVQLKELGTEAVNSPKAFNV